MSTSSTEASPWSSLILIILVPLTGGKSLKVICHSHSVTRICFRARIHDDHIDASKSTHQTEFIDSNQTAGTISQLAGFIKRLAWRGFWRFANHRDSSEKIEPSKMFISNSNFHGMKRSLGCSSRNSLWTPRSSSNCWEGSYSSRTVYHVPPTVFQTDS